MPDRLSIHHDVNISRGLFDPPITILAIATVFFLVGTAFAISKKRPLIGYCILFFFLNHIVESSILPLELVFEHRNYLPSMLFFVPLTIAFMIGLRALEGKRVAKAAIIGFLVLFLIGMGHSTFIRNFTWRTEESLWLDAVDKYPNSPRAHHNLGRFYANTRQVDKAISEDKLALENARGTHGVTYHLTHYNLALIYLKQDRLEKAEEHFLEAIRIAPRFSSAYINLSIVMVKQENYDQAQNYLMTALEHGKRKTAALSNLGYVLIKKNQLNQAIATLQKALALEKNYRPAQINLGIAYKYEGDYEKAARHFRSALRDKPRDLVVRLHLAEVYYRSGKLDSARMMIDEILDEWGPDTLYLELSKLTQDQPTLEAPDESIIMPQLKQAFLDRAVSLKKMGNELWSNSN